MNQESRDLVLKDIDSNKVVSNEDLFLYDLTPYYKFDNNGDSFFNKILNYQNIQEKMIHNKKISFTPEQKRIFNKISEKGRYAISATTSFGKTTIIKEYIKVFKPNLVVYVVPTNALADELLAEFELLFETDNYDIIDTSVSEYKPETDKKIIFIGTQEKLTDINWLKQETIDLFVIDEAYKLNDELTCYREISLNRIFVDYLNMSQTFILLLPLVNNIIGLEKFNITLLKTDYSPVAKEFIGIDSEKFDSEIIEKVNKNKEKTLIYFSSPGSLEEFFWKNVSNLNLENKLTDDWIKRVEKDFHEEWLPVIAYKKGIAIHNGNMPKFIQIKMVKQFNSKGFINNIFSTSSLIEGVNTPTKNIFIKDHNIYSVKNRIKYKNLIGRAGRLNVTPVGKIYYDIAFQSEFESANMNWKNIDLKLIVEDEQILDEINREDKSENIKTFSNEYNIGIEDIIQYLEKSGMTLNNLINLIDKLRKYNKFCEESFYPNSTPGLITVYNMCCYSENRLWKYCIPVKSNAELKDIISKSEKNPDVQKKIIKNIPYSYLKSLFSATINPSINKKPMFNISSMLDYINNNINKECYKHNNSRVVSSIIGFIYSFLPYDLIPLLENIIELNNLFLKYNNSLVDDKIVTYINDQIGKYNIKYFGKTDCTDKERKIIKRLFEYGIPYSVVKDDIEYLVENVNDNFSINHIKKVIEKNQELHEKLNKYFE